MRNVLDRLELFSRLSDIGGARKPLGVLVLLDSQGSSVVAAIGLFSVQVLKPLQGTNEELDLAALQILPVGHAGNLAPLVVSQVFI